MRILVLGGDGMLGHQLLLSLQKKLEIRVTLRQDFNFYKHYGLFNNENSFFNIDVRRDNDLLQVFSSFKPDAVINAVGIIKQRDIAKQAFPLIETNALFPHRLSQVCELSKTRMIHISTDCVFSGKKGKYIETDPSDAEDLYGRSKYLGEVEAPHCLVLRSSIIGLELSRKQSLIEWFLAQKGTIQGFCKAIYTGLTTVEMSRVIEHVLLKNTDLYGIWHVSSDAISKYNLLTMLSTMLDVKKIQIQPEEFFMCDRSLIGEEFFKTTGYQTPSWKKMLTELAEQINYREKHILMGNKCLV